MCMEGAHTCSWPLPAIGAIAGSEVGGEQFLGCLRGVLGTLCWSVSSPTPTMKHVCALLGANIMRTWAGPSLFPVLVAAHVGRSRPQSQHVCPCCAARCTHSRGPPEATTRLAVVREPTGVFISILWGPAANFLALPGTESCSRQVLPPGPFAQEEVASLQPPGRLLLALGVVRTLSASLVSLWGALTATRCARRGCWPSLPANIVRPFFF